MPYKVVFANKAEKDLANLESLIAMKAKSEGYETPEDYLGYSEAAHILQTDTGRIPLAEIKATANSGYKITCRLKGQVCNGEPLPCRSRL